MEEILMEKMRTYLCLYGKRRMHKEHDIKRSACAILKWIGQPLPEDVQIIQETFGGT